MSTLFIESKDATLIEIVIHCQITIENKHEAPAIIIAHPYGPLGGNINNNVVIAIQRHFESKGYVTVCLNFRGCGKSKGRTSWTGLPERNDYMSVIDFLLKDRRYNELHLPKINSLVICGYSFGAMIANSIQCDIPCSYILVSLPLGVMWALATAKAGFFKQHLSQNLKVLCIHGDNDQFTGLNRYKMWCKGHENHIDDVIINSADHFWFDCESHLIKEIENWRLKQLSN